MQQWITKSIAFIFVFAIVAQFLIVPSKVSVVQAQAPGCGTTITTDNPKYNELCVKQVAGSSIDADSIRAAINSPTPNLANTTAYVFYTISILLTGTFDPTYTNDNDTAKELGLNKNDSSISLSQTLKDNGAIGGLGYLIGQMISNPPASAQIYVADVIQNSRFTGEQAYAQGIGFGALNPILGTWKAFRDIAYYLLTVMFLVTGFLILIRHKVSGNVAVTVQSALPKLVITLIMITFSYAIAGLIIDVMYIVIYFMINVFSQGIFLSQADGGPNLANIAFNKHIFQFTIEYIFSGNAWDAASSVGKIISDAITNSTTGFLNDILSIPFVGSVIEGVTSIIFSLIFGIALLIAMFRTFFSLMMSYAGFIVNVVLSPFILLSGAIPGKDPWKNWIKNLIGGLAPFVVAIFMIFMSLALTGQGTMAGIGYQSNDAEELDGLKLPLIMGGLEDPKAILGVLAMGFMLLLPESVKMAKKITGATGGPFDEFKDAAVNNFKRGIKPAKRLVNAGTMGLVGGAVGAYAGNYAAKNNMLGDKYSSGRGRRIATAAGALAGGTIGAVGLGKTMRTANWIPSKLGSLQRDLESADDLYAGVMNAQAARKSGANIVDVYRGFSQGSTNNRQQRIINAEDRARNRTVQQNVEASGGKDTKGAPNLAIKR